ncbi:MAG: YbhB/YbcL family Raf kinase inhibitor-like protein [Pirellulales bacterium]|jgi:Raf kinase inhibitor-like YbhB/YbcL family protein|nr:YbhB/YbcL family Raf kinase inhibitor-like protein [Thermoguttaceae bacterium]MDD4786679.1 YbhB/YbcL family Raf kinase inhibitor-like protein [Pirellulales bacterium]
MMVGQHNSADALPCWNQRGARRYWMFVAAGWFVFFGCAPGDLPPEPRQAEQAETVERSGNEMAFELTSSAFEAGKPIPTKYTEDGEDVSPPLAWSTPPDGTVELALICDDPDAPTPQPWVHWVIYKIPAEQAGLPEGIEPVKRPREVAGVMQGLNSWQSGQQIGYRGPAPPRGHGTHHYHFTLYAFDAALDVQAGLDKEALRKAMSGHVIGEAEVVGTYGR